MKKRDEGYVLLYVLVILLVLTAVALVASSVAIRNLSLQNAAVEDMQNRYEAEGEVEAVYGKLLGKTFASIPDGTTAEQQFIAYLGDAGVTSDDTIDSSLIVDHKITAFPCHFHAEKDGVAVDTDLLLGLLVTQDGDGPITAITIEKIAYQSYTLTSGESGGEEDG